MHKTALLHRFTGQLTPSPLCLPGLTLWHGWHHQRGALPEHWHGHALLAAPDTGEDWRAEYAGGSRSVI